MVMKFRDDKELARGGREKTMNQRGATRGLSLLAALVAVAAGLGSALAADPSLTFSGGTDSPLTINLDTPVTYVATVSSGSAPAFIFQNVGDLYSGVFTVTGNITYSINGGTANAITGIQWNFHNNDVTANDFIMYPDFVTVNAGDTVTLSAGSITTSSSLTGAITPPSGSYASFIASQDGVKLGSGSAVPEPAPLALGLAGLAALLLCHRTRTARRLRLSAPRQA